MSHRPLPSLPSHLRRRSLTETVELLGLPSSPSTANNSRHSFSDLVKSPAADETIVEFSSGNANSAEYYALHSQREEESLNERAERNKGEGDWKNKKQPKRPRPYKGGCIALSLLGIGGALGWLIGAGGSRVIAPARLLSVSDARERVHETGSSSAEGRVCNPYSQPGVLNVSLTVPKDNVWQPVAAPAGCEAVDYLSLVREAVETRKVPDALEFARGKTIAVVGDSVDRDHVTDFCEFAGGELEMIGHAHELSPPYPKGQEVPDADYDNYQTKGSRTWPDNEQSRPWLCRVEALDLVLFNVFHYGFRPRTAYIDHHPHYYPPGQLEDRLDQVVIPILEGIAKKYDRSAVPDIVSVTAGFWGMLRQAKEDDRNKAADIEAGMSPEKAAVKWDTWRSMPKETQDWQQQRIDEVLRYVGSLWADAAQRPRIVWRSLHLIKPYHIIPLDRVVALDAIGTAVVEGLVLKGLAAEGGAKTWAAWVKRQAKKVGVPEQWVPGSGKKGEKELSEAEEEKEALRMGLPRRLRINEWGSRLMNGQIGNFRDDIHPLPLPGSWIYGQTLLEQLKLEVEQREEEGKKGVSIWDY